MKHEKMGIQRIKYPVKNNMNSFKERVSVKIEPTKPENLLSPKEAIVSESTTVAALIQV